MVGTTRQKGLGQRRVYREGRRKRCRGPFRHLPDRGWNAEAVLISARSRVTTPGLVAAGAFHVRGEVLRSTLLGTSRSHLGHTPGFFDGNQMEAAEHH